MGKTCRQPADEHDGAGHIREVADDAVVARLGAGEGQAGRLVTDRDISTVAQHRDIRLFWSGCDRDFSSFVAARNWRFCGAHPMVRACAVGAA
jgi:hypothetical protein